MQWLEWMTQSSDRFHLRGHCVRIVRRFQEYPSAFQIVLLPSRSPCPRRLPSSAAAAAAPGCQGRASLGSRVRRRWRPAGPWDRGGGRDPTGVGSRPWPSTDERTGSSLAGRRPPPKQKWTRSRRKRRGRQESSRWRSKTLYLDRRTSLQGHWNRVRIISRILTLIT